MRRRLRAEIAARTSVFRQATLANVAAAKYTWAEGLTIEAAAERLDTDPAELVCELLLASRLACRRGRRRADRTEEDLRALLRHRAHMARLPTGSYVGGRPAPARLGRLRPLPGSHTRELGDWTGPRRSRTSRATPARRVAG